MRITYIHQYFHLPNEGGGSRPYEFARRMAADGHVVTMICAGEEKLDGLIDGIRIKRLPIRYDNSMSVRERIISFIRFMFVASLHAARTPSDVVFASSTPLTVAVPGIVGKIFQRVPMVFEVRDLWPQVPIELGFLKNPILIVIARLLEKLAYRSSRSIVALAPAMRDGVLKVDPAADTAIIPNASDFDLFDKPEGERISFRLDQGWQDGEVVVVYAGGFGYVYELDWVVLLAAELKQDPIRFVLLGEGSSTEELHRLATDLGLNSNELLPGRKSKEEVAKFVASADIVLSTLRPDPSLEACSLNKVFDGMAAGRPILLNHGGWLNEAVVQAGAGWHVSREVTEAAQLLRQLARERLLLEEKGEKSRELGKLKFSREEQYRKLIRILDRATRLDTSEGN